MSDLNTLCLTVIFDSKTPDGNYRAFHNSKDIMVPVLLRVPSASIKDAFDSYQQGDLLMVMGELFMPKDRDRVEVTVYQVTKQEPDAVFNSLTVTGRFGRDAEIKYFEDGNAVSSGSIAVNGFRNEKTTMWINVRAFKASDSNGGVAEVLANYCKKGTQVGITGKLTFARSNSGMEYYPDLNTVRLLLLGSKNGSPTPSSINPADFEF